MKKAFYTLICVSTIIGFSSCTKSYTCACTFPDTSKNFEVTLEKMRKNEAKTICDDYSVYVGNCGLK